MNVTDSMFEKLAVNYQTTTFSTNTSKPQVIVRNDYNLYCFLGSQDYLYPFQALNCFINPLLSLLGLFINGLCLIILTKSGLRKTSNILLFALVLADSMNMFTNLDFPNRIRLFGPIKSKPGYCTFEYDTTMNQFLYVSQQFFIFVGDWGQTISATIPMIITIERILAVYFPVTFTRIVNVKSVTASCGIAYIIWLPYAIVQTFYRRLDYIQLSSGNKVAFITSTEFLIKNFSILYTFSAYALEALASWGPICFISLGCVLIGIKVYVSISHRRKLTNVSKKHNWSPRTTRTLVTTCLIFVITHTITALISMFATVDLKSPLLTFLIVEISAFLNILCCTSNFFVYFLCNDKLSKIFFDLIRTRKNSNV
ncbi:G-protein coupled receptor [Biomphalaria glabrata]|nr:G-protein coupled receptor [Biomphalaria glabrata]